MIQFSFEPEHTRPALLSCIEQADSVRVIVIQIPIDYTDDQFATLDSVLRAMAPQIQIPILLLTEAAVSFIATDGNNDEETERSRG